MSRFLTRQGETVFVTGATGYVGSAVAARLCAAGYDVVGLTRQESQANALSEKGVRPVVGDASDAALMVEASAGAAAIVHTAAPNDPSRYDSMETMIAATAQVLETMVHVARESGARLLATSGTSIYGDTAGQIVDEDGPLQPMPGTEVLKDLEAQIIQGAHAHIIRLGVVYGGGESAPMRQFRRAIQDRGSLAVVNPDNRLSVVQIDDLADLYQAILEAADPPQVVNAVSEILPWPEVVDAIGKGGGIAGSPERIAVDEAMTLGGPAMFMPIDMAVSAARAREQLDWRPHRQGFRGHFSVLA
ncbi:MAG: NAD-dependent epimerase/dehydratase family protein [Pseudomonadota bacterium]